MDKELPLNGNAHTQMAGLLCSKQELWAVLSNLLQSGQVLAGAPTATPTEVCAPESPTRTAVADVLCRNPIHKYIHTYISFCYKGH